MKTLPSPKPPRNKSVERFLKRETGRILEVIALYRQLRGERKGKR